MKFEHTYLDRRTSLYRFVPAIMLVCFGPAGSAEAAFEDEVLALNPVAYWRLGESAGTVAVDEVGNNDGTYFGGPALGQPGGVLGDSDTSVLFDEDFDDSVRIPNFDYTSAGNTDFSLALLFKTLQGDPGNGGGAFEYLFSHGSVSASDNINLWFCEGNSCDNLFGGVEGSGTGLLRVGVGNSDSGDVIINANTAFNHFGDDAWHMAVVTLEQGVGTTVYVDGNVVGTNSSTATGTFDPGTDLIIGGRSDLNSGRFYDGDADEVMVFDYALDQTKVSDLTSAALGVSGDFDGDDDVDGADFLKWQRELGDATNLTLWQDNFGTPAAAPAIAAVPEPASWILICTMMALIAPRRRHPFL